MAPPAHGPPRTPARGPERPVPPVAHDGPAPARPHIERSRWVGHDMGPHDQRFHLEHPWAAGRFRGGIGRSHLHRLRGWDSGRHRFWIEGSYFAVAPWEAEYVDDWDWSGDDIALYDDPDHPGWYVAYNTRLGTYVHIQYDGPMG